MFNRYNNSVQIINSSETYSDILLQKKLNSIKQYSGFDFTKLNELLKQDLDRTFHTVEPFEKLYMISQKYYNSPEFGWLICYTNKISSELNIKIGQTLVIYLSIEQLLEALR